MTLLFFLYCKCLVIQVHSDPPRTQAPGLPGKLAAPPGGVTQPSHVLHKLPSAPPCPFPPAAFRSLRIACVASPPHCNDATPRLSSLPCTPLPRSVPSASHVRHFCPGYVVVAMRPVASFRSLCVACFAYPPRSTVRRHPGSIPFAVTGYLLTGRNALTTSI